MCGIFGLVAEPDNRLISREDAEACLLSMSHRGPDAHGFEDFDSDGARGFLGHVRLSIIDLSGGRQPMASDDSNLLLSFNGEIYNYLSLKEELQEKGHFFKESSDTEVLLHAYQEWGEDCVRHLRGMFAFAIWDEGKGSLFLARDHFGKKPVFYVEHANALYFASEIKALQKISGLALSFDKSQVRNYTVYRYVPSPRTFIREIHKLPAGSTLTWRDGSYDIKRYFYPAETSEPTKKSSPEDAVAGFWDKLDESVRLRMAADVPFGAFLSGGIDSSAVVALMHEHSSQKVKTFSIGFSEAEYSELEYAAVIARQFETDHTELVVSQDDLMSLLPEVIAYRDAPVCEPSDIPIYLLAKEARKTVKMVLTGEGSDEILAGYPKHSFERFVAAYHFLPRVVRQNILGPIVSSLPYRFRRAKTAIQNMNCDRFEERMPGWFGALDAKRAEELVALPGQESLPGLSTSLVNDGLHNILLFDQLSWLPDNLLERGDRMTMAASLEARMPFMDVELARYAASLPNKYRIKGMTTKWVLRKAMESVLPKTILERPKVGFRVPVNVWFQTTMREYLEEHLLGMESITKCFYHKSALETLVKEHVTGRQNHEKVLWMLLNLEIWLRQNSGNLEIDV